MRKLLAFAVAGTPLFVVAVVFSVVATTPGVGRAQTDDFNDGNDNGWTRYDPLSAANLPGSFDASSGAYRIQATASPNPNATGPARAASYLPDQYTNTFSVAVDLVNWNNSLDQAFGVLARLSQVGPGTSDGYAFTYATQGPSIDISKITDEAPSGLGSAPVTLDPTHDYRLVFQGNGPNLTGTVYDLANPSVPLATATGTDPSYVAGTGGTSGLLVADNSNGTGAADATFDNYAASATVPEPAGLAAVGMVALRMLARRSRR